jgi:RNA recognition motif-containing protein
LFFSFSFVQLPYTTSWQDLKDRFRQAGNIIRADVLLDTTGRSKGQGTVLFESPGDAQKAIRMYPLSHYTHDHDGDDECTYLTGTR